MSFKELDFQEQKQRVRVEYKDQESGIHVNIQESEHRGKEKESKTCFWISAHYNKDRHYNSVELNATSLAEAKVVATKVYEFMKEIRPQLHLFVSESDSTCGCDE